MQIQPKRERIILGIDPGTVVLGYGLIKESGSTLSLICLGVVKLSHLDDQALKLKAILDKVNALIDQYHPDCMALEAPFYGKNPQVLLKLGRAQGVTMATALQRGLPIVEYAPRKIKQAVTGNGNASKEQVAAMLKNLLKFEESPQFLDATDGLAVAVCHAFQKTNTSGKSTSYSGWSSFVKDQSDRIL